MSQISEVKSSLLEAKEEYTLYKYRFVILIVYVIAINQTIMMFSIPASLQSTLVKIYNEELTYVNFATILIGNVSFIPASFISNYIIDTFGLRKGFLIGSVLNFIGLWLRCLSKHGFGWIFAGQCFAGLAQPYFSTVPQKISSTWFGASERALATTLMVCGNLIGTAVGLTVPQLFVDLTADNETIMDQLQKMFFYIAIFSSVCYVFVNTLMREKPPTPPSKAAAAIKFDYVSSLKNLLKDKNTMMMLIGTAIVNGTLTNYGSTVQQVVQPLGINGYQVADIFAIAVFIAPVGSILGAFFIAKYKKYNLMIVGASTLSLGFLVLNLIAAENGNIYFYGVTVIIYILAVSPIVPITYEYGIELAFPVAEATIGGVYSVINQFSATIESLIVDSILGKTPSRGDARTSFIVIAGYQALAIILLFFVKEKLKRREFESKGKDESEEPGLLVTSS